MDGPLACRWLWLLPPLSLRRFRCFLSVVFCLSLPRLPVTAAVAPLILPRRLARLLLPPLLAAVQFLPPGGGGLLGTAVRRK